jgi:hypothetical protein
MKVTVRGNCFSGLLNVSSSFITLNIILLHIIIVILLLGRRADNINKDLMEIGYVVD